VDDWDLEKATCKNIGPPLHYPSNNQGMEV
jgi:hypothetical protein